MKKTVWFCQTVRVKGKTFSKEKSKTWEKEFLKKMEWYSERARTAFFFRNDVTKNTGEKKVVEMRRHWPGFVPKSKFTHHNCPSTCNVALHKAFWETQSSFFLIDGKKPLHYDTDIDRTIVVLRFADHLPQFLKTLNSVNLSWHHTQQCTVSVAPRQFSAPFWAAPSVKRTTPLLRLRSRLVRCFHLASFRVRFSVRALPSITHFIISFQPTPHLLPVNLFPFQNIARVHPRRPRLSNFFPQVLRPSLAGHKLEPFMVVAHVLFADDESRGDSISASLLVSSSKLLSCLSTFLFF